MTDLRTLLHEAAPVPSRPLDMTAVRERSQRLGLRRVIALVTGLGAVAALGVPVSNLALSPSGGDTSVAVGAGRPTTTTTSAPAVTATTVGAGAAAGGAVGGTAGAALPGGEPGSGPGSSPTPGSPGEDQGSGAPVPATTDYPPAPSCSVDSVALGPDEQRRCRFTATTRGGASIRSEGPVSPDPSFRGEVTITRDGVSNTYLVRSNVEAGDAGAFAFCGPFVEPGDLVEVVLTNVSTATPEHTTRLGAGEGWYCWD